MRSDLRQPTESPPAPTWRATLYLHLEPSAWRGPGLSPANRAVIALILFGAAVAVLETEASLRVPADAYFRAAEMVLLSVFALEYLARWYASGEDPRFAGPFGRIRYVFSFWSIIDLLAILPMLITLGGTNTFLFRVLKMLRLLRVARLGHFSDAWDAIAEALHSRRFELTLSIGIAGFLLLLSSVFLYTVEANEQPEAFGSIPRTLWWSVATLTTVGYGDVTPVTAAGRILAGVTAIAGIGLIAMPTGILAAAFSDAIRRRAKTKDSAE